jgi:HSP20 family molecular chaperone IbpA
MKATPCKVLGLVIALAAGSAVAQAPYGEGPWGGGPGAGGPGYFGGPMGPVSRVWLDVETQTERDLFVVGIRYTGIAPEELKIEPQDGDLLIQVERSTQQQGPQGRMFSGGRMSRRVGLPAGADVSTMQRQDGPGFVTLFVPRRMMGPRW